MRRLSRLLSFFSLFLGGGYLFLGLAFLVALAFFASELGPKDLNGSRDEMHVRLAITPAAYLLTGCLSYASGVLCRRRPHVAALAALSVALGFMTDELIRLAGGHLPHRDVAEFSVIFALLVASIVVGAIHRGMPSNDAGQSSARSLGPHS